MLLGRLAGVDVIMLIVYSDYTDLCFTLILAHLDDVACKAEVGDLADELVVEENVACSQVAVQQLTHTCTHTCSVYQHNSSGDREGV